MNYDRLFRPAPAARKEGLSLNGKCSLFVGHSEVKAFSLVELLTVITIIAIIAAISVPAIGSLLRSNQLDQSITTLSGLMEQAREAAVSRDCFVWVAFSTPSSQPSNGVWVATFQSLDGTESPINTTVTPSWATTAAVPSTNLQMLNKLQNLPGVQIVDASALASATVTAINTANTGAPPPTANVTTLFEPSTMQWTVTPLQFASGYSSSSYFVKAIEFTPSGGAGAGATTWYNYIQFGLLPATGSNPKNAALISVSRLTGKTTVYRP